MIRRFGSEAKKPPKLTKLVDLKKDGWTRLKLLKQFALIYDLETFKLFFKDNASALFFTVHDCFCQYDVDNNGKQRASSRTSLPEELDLVFTSFEKILCYLPELVQKRWHFNSILTILRRLLHPSNKLLLKAIGIKLFILWYKILQNEASEICHQIFASLLPGLGTTSPDFDTAVLSFKHSSSGSLSANGVQAESYLPILIDHKPEQQQNPYGSLDTLVETFLASMSPDCPQVYWVDPDMHSSSCTFLLTQFLEFYGTRLFPCLNVQPFNVVQTEGSTLKSQSSHTTDPNDSDGVDGEWEKATILPVNGGDVVAQLGVDVLARCQSTILTWLLRHITVSSSSSSSGQRGANNNSHDIKKGGTLTGNAGSGAKQQADVDDTPFGSDGNGCRDQLPGSSDAGNGDMMQRSQGSDTASSGGGDSCGEADEQASNVVAISDTLRHSHSVTSSIGSATMPSGDRLLLRALTGNRDMVSAIHTMLRHAYYLPPSHLATVAAVTRTYREWLRKAAALVARRHSRLSQSDEEQNSEENNAGNNNNQQVVNTQPDFTYEENRWTGGLPFDSLVSVFLSSSAAAFSQMGFQSSTATGANTSSSQSQTSASNIQQKVGGGPSSGALPPVRELSNSQQPSNMAYYEVAMYILSTCHDLVVSHSNTMSRDGWELLLNTLLGFIDCRLPSEPDADDSDKRIVRYLIQTLLVTLVRASLFVPIPAELWDRASSKMAQFASNQDVLGEWIKCVRKMTELFSIQALEVNWRSAVAAALASERMTSAQGGRSGRMGYRLNRQPSSSMSNHSHHYYHQQSQALSAGGGSRRFVERRVPTVSATAVKRPHALQYAPLVSPPLVSNTNDRSDGTLHFDSKQQTSQRIPSYIVVPNRANRISDYFSSVRSDDDVSFTLPYAAGSAVHQRLRSLSGNSPQAISSLMSLPQKSSPSGMESPNMEPKGHSSSSDKIDRAGVIEQASPPAVVMVGPQSNNMSVQLLTENNNASGSLVGPPTTKKSQSMGDLTVLAAVESLQANQILSARHSASEEVFQSPHSPGPVSPNEIVVEEADELYSSAAGTVIHVCSAPVPLAMPSSPELTGGSVPDTVVAPYSVGQEQHDSGGLGPDPDSRPGSGLVMVDRAASSLGFCGQEDSNSNVLSSERDSFSLHLPQEIVRTTDATSNKSEPNGIIGDGDQLSTNTTTSKQLSNNSMITGGNSEVDDDDKEQGNAILTNQAGNGSAEGNIFSRPVLAGGNTLGWTPTSAYVIWRRLLGIIGNPNTSLAQDPNAHLTVFRFLSDTARGLVACREAQSLNATIRPDIFIFVPLFFDSLHSFSPNESDFLQSHVIAVDVLSRVLCLQHDPELSPPADFVTAYYLAIHGFIANHNKPLIGALVHAMNVRFIGSCLPGKTLLFADLANACQIVVDGYLEQPSAMSSSFVGGEGGGEFSKLESAISLMGSLICFTRSHGPEMVCLDPGSEDLLEKPVSCLQVTDQIISTLLKMAERPVFYGAPRLGQLLVCTLTIFLSHECENSLINEQGGSEHANFDPVFRQLSGVVRYVPHAVDREGALEVCESAVLSFLHLSNYAKRVLSTRSGEELVRNLILDLSTILYWLCHHAESCSREAEMRLGCLMTYCLIEWSLAVPIDFLLQTVKFPSGPHALVYKVFKGLTVAATKGSQYPGAVKSATLNEVSNGSLRPESGIDSSISSSVNAAGASKSETQSTTLKPSQAPSLLQLAARWALAYLLQHLGLYPYSTTSSPVPSGAKDTSFGAGEGQGLDSESSSPVQYIALHGQAIISVHADEEASTSQVDTFGLSPATWSMSEKSMSLSIRDISGNYAWMSRLVCGDRSACAEAHSWPVSSPQQAIKEPCLVSVSTEKYIGSVGEPASQGDCQFLKILNEIRSVTNEPSYSNLASSDEVVSTCDVEEAVSHCAEVEDRFMREEWAQGGSLAPPGANPNEQPKCDSAVVQQGPACLLTRLFMESLGWLTAGHGGFDIVHLRASESFFRDLRHLDHLRSDTHKVAVAYVARGQEDSASVLRNSGGSPEYETFVSGLGWSVPVASHQGFLGGVARDGSYGPFIPYFGSATAEVAFHVATLISPGSTLDETIRKRTKHLGNDEVQVVWSEHWRRYKRDIIPGDFGDVVIIIRPLTDLGLYQVSIERKHGFSATSDAPHLVIGPPLYNGAVLDAATLAAAVRSTALGASRSLAFARPHYRPFFAERHGHIQYVIHKYRQPEGLANFVTELSFAAQTGGGGASTATSTTATNTPSIGFNSLVSSSQSMMQLQQPSSQSSQSQQGSMPSMLSSYSLIQQQQNEP